MEYRLVNDLEMKPTVGDPALYTKEGDGKGIGVRGFYVDDSLNDGLLSFDQLS